MSVYAVGKKAFGFCDRCGFRYPLEVLRKETVNAFKIDLRVCEECWDPDHPQNKLGKENPSDPQALFDPRPDTGLTASRYGDSVLWDFDSSTDYWVSSTSSGSPSMTVAWVAGVSPPSDISIGKEITASGILSQKTPVLMRLGTADNSSSVSLDSSVYKVIRMRIKRTSPWVSSSGVSGWTGLLYWNSSGSAFTGSKSLSVTEPDWDEIGDPFRTLVWKVNDDAAWSGTVDKMKVEFHAIGSDTWTSVGSYTIDYIRAEES